jgi:hypothetical protein
MKYLLIFLLSLGLIASCSKGNKDNDDCVAVTITQSGTPCGAWGIKVASDVYPSNNIPSQYQQEGVAVCVVYELYQDPRVCACCGGTWADIKSIKTFVR